MWSSPLFTNTSKIQPPVEQFSQKTNEKRAEDLLYCTTEAACTVEQKLSAPACGARGRWRQTLLACTPSGLPEPHVSSRHPWEEYRAAPFPVESDLVLPTSHPSLELDGGWRGPGGTPAEAARALAAAEGPPFLQLQHPNLSAPA